MPADRDVAVRLVCRRLGAADEGGLPAYVRERLEREIRPLLASPLVAPDDPLVLQAAEGIIRDWRLLEALGRPMAVLQALASIDRRLAALEQKLAPPAQAAPAGAARSAPQPATRTKESMQASAPSAPARPRPQTQAPASSRPPRNGLDEEPIVVVQPPEGLLTRAWTAVKAFVTTS